MKKGKKRFLIPIIIFLLIVLGGVFLIIRQTSLAGGFTIKSISTTKVISNDADLSNTFFLIDTVANGGGQSIVGTITPQQTKSLSGYETKYPLEISISAIDETVDINIENLGLPIYKYNYYEAGAFSSCSSTAEYNILVNVFTRQKLCVQKYQIGTQGRLQQASTKFRGDISVEVNGNKITKEISSDTSSVNFYDGNKLRATAQWAGSLITGDGLPNFADYVPVFWADAIDQWKLIRESTKDKYDSEQTQLRSQLSSWQSSGWSGLNEMKGRIDSFNTYVSQEVETENVKIQSSTLLDKTSKDTGKVRFSLDRRTTNPNILFKVAADWVGVKIPVGMPKILKVESEEFNSGEKGNIKVTILNDGDATGTFAIDIKDCSPFDNKYSAETNKVTLTPHNTITIPIELSTGNINQDIAKDCTVRVYDVNNPSNEALDKVKVTMKRAVACEEGKKWLDGNCITECKDGEAKTVQCCEFGVKFEDNKYVCTTEKDDKEGETTPSCKPLIDIKNPINKEESWIKIDNPFCNLKSRLSTISIIAGVLIGIALLFTGKVNFYDNVPKKKRSNFNLVLVLVFSAGGGYLTYFLIQSFFDYVFSFWGIITIIIVLIILRFFNNIKRTLGLK